MEPIVNTFSIPFVGARPVPGHGIVAVAGLCRRKHCDFATPVVLLCDLYFTNRGVALADTLKLSVSYVANQLSECAMPFHFRSQITWVLVDRHGNLDQLHPEWDAAGQILTLEHSPIFNDDHFDPRSLDAFMSCYDKDGFALWQRLAQECALASGAKRPHETSVLEHRL